MFLRSSSVPPPFPGLELLQQRLRDQKYDVLEYYQLDGGNLHYRQSSDRDSPRQMITEGEIFDSIKQEHIELNHTGMNKTYQALQKRFMGSTRKGSSICFEIVEYARRAQSDPSAFGVNCF